MTTSENLQAVLPASFAPSATSLRRALASIARSSSLAVRYAELALRQLFARRTLDRLPEPHRITEQRDFVDDYNRVAGTVMMAPYALALDLVHRLVPQESCGRAVDLCCGPGHFTKLLARHLACRSVTGVDLSQPMLAAAAANARSAGVGDRVSFAQEDVSRLASFPDQCADLVTFMNGAHHADSLAGVTAILTQAERICRADGVIFVLDPVRLKTRKLSQRYADVGGADYLRRGMHCFHRDFLDSLLASWTPTELAQAIPSGSQRRWLRLLPRGFPTFQILIGIPAGRRQAFLRSPLAKETLAALLPREVREEWRLLRSSFRFGNWREVFPNASARADKA